MGFRMFGFGFGEILVILVVALLVFGPERLPEIARTLGRTMAEFRRAMDEMRYEFNSARMDMEHSQPTVSPQPAVSPQAAVPQPVTAQPLAPLATTALPAADIVTTAVPVAPDAAAVEAPSAPAASSPTVDPQSAAHSTAAPDGNGVLPPKPDYPTGH